MKTCRRKKGLREDGGPIHECRYSRKRRETSAARTKAIVVLSLHVSASSGYLCVGGVSQCLACFVRVNRDGLALLFKSVWNRSLTRYRLLMTNRKAYGQFGNTVFVVQISNFKKIRRPLRCSNTVGSVSRPCESWKNGSALDFFSFRRMDTVAEFKSA